MIPLLVSGGIALFLGALLALPIHLTVTYREQVTVRLRVLFYTVTLFPAKEKSPQRLEKEARKKAKKAKKKPKRVKKKQKKQQLPAAPEKKRTLQENLVLVRGLVSALIRKTNGHLRLKAARIHLRVATGDAATTALAYGAASASLAFLLAALDRVTKLRAKPGDVMVIADYLSERSSADVKLIFTLRVWGALSTLLGVALAYLKQTLPPKAKKQPQGKHPTTVKPETPSIQPSNKQRI